MTILIPVIRIFIFCLREKEKEKEKKNKEDEMKMQNDGWKKKEDRKELIWCEAQWRTPLITEITTKQEDHVFKL